jgi:hypothetical protein
MTHPIPQPLEGSHPSKADVPGDLPTSATAGEDKGEPDDGEHHFTGEASLAPEHDDRSSAESAEWEPSGV